MDLKDTSQKLASIRRDAENREAKRIAEKNGLEFIDLYGAPVEQDALKVIPQETAKEINLIPVALKAKKLVLATANPEDKKVKETTSKLEKEGYSVELMVASKSGIGEYTKNYAILPTEERREIISRVELSEEKIDSIREKVGNIETAKTFAENSINSTTSTTEVLEDIVAAALSTDASDIHFETSKEKVLLRFRIDGLLHDLTELEHDVYKQVLNRIKLMSGLKINITDTPQDGRFTVEAGTEEIETRVSIIPSEFGEAIVMRILDPKAISLSLTDLGLREDDRETVDKEIKRPNGMILVTGPTGSGKTTTLYAFLKAVADSETKIITIEDPIEYHLSGIEQTQTDSKSGYTFAAGLRSILRQDPDKILVGEIRDKETAEVAINASLTGHLVFSTLHTNTAVGAVPRLIDIGVKPNIVGPALTLVIAQRLVRKLCEHCRVEKELDPELKEKIEKFTSSLPEGVKKYTEDIKTYEAKGCEKCSGGYKGRIGIFELLEMGGEYEELIDEDVTEYSLKKYALEHGYLEMQADGVLKVLAGYTTFKEVEKVTGPIEWV